MDEKIFELLDEIKSSIQNNKFDEDEKENIYSSLISFINKDYTLDKKMLQYLITGWNIVEQFEKSPS